MSNKVLNVLLIEDDKAECIKFENYIKTRNDVKLIASTDSDIEGLELIKKTMPDAIILDIELHNGSGNANSFDLIENLQKMKFSKRPKIVVNTVVSSNTVYDYLHDKGIDLIFYKKQQNYSIENVINTLVLLSGYSEDKSLTGNIVIEDNKENEEKISNIINDELNLIGIGLHMQGRKYLHDAIYYIITNTDGGEKISAVQYLVNKYKRASSTISRDMQNAILHAWRVSSLEDLETYYTAKINYETGVPTPTEFIYYYADKIKKILK
ncbi:MAG: response regulator [Clostridia bacterium]|nr:response regulator [Clostridia bacterium]